MDGQVADGIRRLTRARLIFLIGILNGSPVKLFAIYSTIALAGMTKGMLRYMDLSI